MTTRVVDSSESWKHAKAASRWPGDRIIVVTAFDNQPDLVYTVNEEGRLVGPKPIHPDHKSKVPYPYQKGANRGW